MDGWGCYYGDQDAGQVEEGGGPDAVVDHRVQVRTPELS